MEQSKPDKSVTVMVAEELAAFAKRLTTMGVAPDERAVVLGLFGETCEALACTANTIAQDVADETPIGGLLGTANGGLPPAGCLVDEASEAASHLAKARDGFEEAVKATEDLATGQAEAREPVEEPYRVSTTYATPGAQVLLAELRTRLADTDGVTR